MGATYVEVTIRNPRICSEAGPVNSWSVPEHSTRSSLGRTSKRSDSNQKGSGNTSLRNGNKVAFDITTADLEFKGEVVGGTIVYGDEGAEPLLGVTALESGGIRGRSA